VSAVARAALVVLPASAIVFSVVIVLRLLDEPFGIFRWGDAVILRGGPPLVGIVWLVWVVVAFRRRRAFGGLLLVAGCVAVLNVWFLLETCFFRYLREPWNP
jgi:hypothetical protein